MNSHIHDDHFEPTRPPVVSGSRASRVEETPTAPPPVVPAIQVENETIQQEIVEEVQTQEDLQEQGVVRRSTRKKDLSRNISTDKTSLVAKCFSQIHGIDYEETFWAVAMFKSKSDYACYCCIS